MSAAGAAAAGGAEAAFVSAAASKLPAGVECLNGVIDFTNVTVLNGTHANGASIMRAGNQSILSSDADEQLLITIPFTETVRLSGISFIAPEGESAPVTVKIFSNPLEMDFSDAESTAATMSMELAAEDLAPDSFNALKFVKFQQVFKLVIFIEDNGGADSTSLSGIEIFGKKVHTTNMTDLKKC
jgi:hypothetical protein